MNFFQNAAALAAEAHGTPATRMHTSRLTDTVQFRGRLGTVMTPEQHNATLDHVDTIYANCQRVQVLRMDDVGAVAHVSFPGT